MFSKTITYADLFEEKEITETLWFNLSESEVQDLNIGPRGGLEEYMKGLMENIDDHREEVLDFMKKIIIKAYGAKMVVNGKMILNKNQDSKDAFVYSGAFDAVYLEILKNPETFLDFLRLSVNSKTRARIDEARKNGELNLDTVPITSPEILEITKADAKN